MTITHAGGATGGPASTRTGAGTAYATGQPPAASLRCQSGAALSSREPGGSRSRAFGAPSLRTRRRVDRARL